MSPAAVLAAAEITPAPSPAPSATSKATATPPDAFRTFRASALQRTSPASPRAIPASAAAAVAGGETICTDHMVTAAWSAATGWSAPQLRPYGPLEVMPTASVLHYATTCFEGLKAYRGTDGRVRLFRPDCNARRMLESTQRIALPGFEPDELLALMLALVAADADKWLPATPEWEGCFLYLRPTMVGTSPQLGVVAPHQATLFIIMGYLPRLDAPAGGLRLRTSPEDTIRAWKGGSGSAKVGANYGPTMVATGHAREEGFHQVLWLYGEDGWCTEAGASNLFVVLRRRRDEGGGVELVTAPLDDRLILDGVTRRSVLQLARERRVLDGEAVDVVERPYAIGELVAAAREGRIVEAFAAGTAVSRSDVLFFFIRGVFVAPC
jgi:branched-chain amino acid aminotransferase